MSIPETASKPFPARATTAVPSRPAANFLTRVRLSYGEPADCACSGDVVCRGGAVGAAAAGRRGRIEAGPRKNKLNKEIALMPTDCARAHRSIVRRLSSSSYFVACFPDRTSPACCAWFCFSSFNGFDFFQYNFFLCRFSSLAAVAKFRFHSFV